VRRSDRRRLMRSKLAVFIVLRVPRLIPNLVTTPQPRSERRYRSFRSDLVSAHVIRIENSRPASVDDVYNGQTLIGGRCPSSA